MSMDFLKNISHFAEIFSPIFLYLFLFIRIILEKIDFLKAPPFEKVFYFIKNILHILIFIASLIFSLGIFGIDVQGIITGLGLFSFALGFALKDVISNFLSGLSMLFYGPFKVGDNITIDGYRGTVIKMDIRYTVLEKKTDDLKTELCYIPNSYLIGTKIILERRTQKKNKERLK
jgi:small-conductance mechanosensitive channel